MKLKLSTALLLTVSALSAQWTTFSTSAPASSNLSGAMDGKINWQTSTSACAGLNGTVGKDRCTDTSTGIEYVPSVTGTPATWVAVGSATMSVGTIFSPYGAMVSTSNNTAIGTNNKVVCESFAVPVPWTVQYVATFFFANTGTASFGIYKAGSLITGGQSATSVASGETVVNLALNSSSPLLLVPGKYSMCWTSTVSTDSIFVAGNGPEPSFGAAVNAGYSTPNLNLYSCANSSTAGAMPSTCGTQTAISGLGSSPAFYWIMK